MYDVLRWDVLKSVKVMNFSRGDLERMNIHLINLIYLYLQLFQVRKGASNEVEDRDSEKLNADFKGTEVRR